ncbi:MAG: N-acetylmuramoyl-L-alanine amidase, partial [Flavisolibacter sp.]
VYEVNPDLLKRKIGIWVLDQNVCPSVLLECGFITNEKDRNFISSDKNQEALARKILSSIEYFAALRNQPSVADTIPLSKRSNTDNLMVGDLKINYVPASKTKAPYYHVTGGNIVVNKQKIKINDAEIEMPMDTVPVTEPVFQKVEIEAGINKTTWANFLSTHLDDVLHTLAQKAPPGQYTAYMRFIVKKDGSLVDPTVVKDPGYGVGEKLVEVLKQSPRWLPAYQNGKPVNSYHTQPITLVIAAQ